MTGQQQEPTTPLPTSTPPPNAAKPEWFKKLVAENLKLSTEAAIHGRDGFHALTANDVLRARHDHASRRAEDPLEDAIVDDEWAAEVLQSRMALASTAESPYEVIFLDELIRQGIRLLGVELAYGEWPTKAEAVLPAACDQASLVTQFQFSGARLDLAVFARSAQVRGYRMFGIEVDGFDYHEAPEQIAYDHDRDRRLMKSHGFEILRARASEIEHRPVRTAERIWGQIAAVMKW